MSGSPQKHIPIVTFHKVDYAFEWGVTRLPPPRFNAILRFLKENGYTTVSLQVLLNTKPLLPPKPVVITFDDSYESVYTHAFPLMQKYHFSGTVFVIAGFVGRMNTWDVNLGGKMFRHLSWDQILEMKNNGFEIGSHTVRHPDLTRMDSKRLRVEVERSKKTIEDKTGSEVQFISFPFGRYNTRVIDACKSAEYKRGCGFWIRVQEKKVQEPFVLERKAYYLFDGIWNLKAKLQRNSWTPFENAKLRLVNFCSHGTSLVKSIKY